MQGWGTKHILCHDYSVVQSTVPRSCRDPNNNNLVPPAIIVLRQRFKIFSKRLPFSRSQQVDKEITWVVRTPLWWLGAWTRIGAVDMTYQKTKNEEESRFCFSFPCRLWSGARGSERSDMISTMKHDNISPIQQIYMVATKATLPPKQCWLARKVALILTTYDVLGLGWICQELGEGCLYVTTLDSRNGDHLYVSWQ